MDIGLVVAFFRRAAGLLLAPSGFVVVCLFLGLFLWPLKRKRLLARTLFSLAFFVYCVAGTSFVANGLMRGLERDATGDASAQAEPQSIRKVVVLCGGVVYSDSLPLVDRLSEATRLRILKAYELVRHNPGIDDLIVSGGCTRLLDTCPEPQAELASRWLGDLGLPETLHVRLESLSTDTASAVGNIVPLVGDEPFYLVTSAYEMPRALMLARRQGLKAVPAPCNFMGGATGWAPVDFWPTPTRLGETDLALREYLEVSWLWLREKAAFLPTKI